MDPLITLTYEEAHRYQVYLKKLLWFLQEREPKGKREATFKVISLAIVTEDLGLLTDQLSQETQDPPP